MTLSRTVLVCHSRQGACLSAPQARRVCLSLCRALETIPNPSKAAVCRLLRNNHCAPPSCQLPPSCQPPLVASFPTRNFPLMAGRLPEIDTSALRASPALRPSSGGSVRQHPYANNPRRGPPAGVLSASLGRSVSARDRSTTPHGGFGSLTALELPQSGVFEPGGAWGNAASIPLEASLQHSRSHTGSSESSPVVSFNMQNMDADPIEARFPSYSAPPSTWDSAGGHDVATHASGDAGLHPSPYELEVLISKFHLDTQREMIRDFSKVSRICLLV